MVPGWGAESWERVCLITARWRLQAVKTVSLHFLAKTVPPPAHFIVCLANGKTHCLSAASFSEGRSLEFGPYLGTGLSLSSLSWVFYCCFFALLG